MIGKERVEYWEKGGNYLGNLRRGTKGTGARSVDAQPTGTLVIDMGRLNVFATDMLERSTYSADGVTTSYALPMSLAVADHNPACVQVYVGGKKITTGYTVDVSGGSYNQVTFSEAPKSGLQVVVAIKQAESWYDVTDPNASLATTNNIWAEFIREKPSVFDVA